MANSASDARGGEAEVRKNIVESGMVDVMITVASNFFYTVTLPVTLWFFDKAKTRKDHLRHDQVLFIDARHIFHQVSRALREFTQAQQLNIAAIVWLYRGETANFHDLRARYMSAFATWRNEEVIHPEADPKTNAKKIYRGLATHRQQLAGAFKSLAEGLQFWFTTVELLLSDKAKAALTENPAWVSGLNELTNIDAATLTDKATIHEWFKKAEEAVSFAEKTLRPEKDKSFNRSDIKGLLRRLGEERDDTLFVLERIAYFEAQLLWLDTHFPEGQWRDVEGLCRIADRSVIREQQYSLNPGRYVGVALEKDGMNAEEFQSFIQTQADTLAALHTEADSLQRQIVEDVKMLSIDLKAIARI